VRRSPQQPSPVIPTQRRSSRSDGPLVPLPRTATHRWVAPLPEVHAEPVDPVHPELRELRGVVHDVGNGLSTMALLLEAVRAGTVSTFGLPDLVEQETARLLAVVHRGTPGAADAAVPSEPVAVRSVLGPIARLAMHVGETSVRVLPGADVIARVDPAVLSRVVTNLVDNAVRAAGPAGSVRLAVHRAGSGGQDVVIDVVDDGPGFPLGPPGSGRSGLELANRLLTACGGRLELHEAAPCGTRARVVLPGTAADRLPPAVG
jgi:signal transduction histidine kinase